MVMKTRFTRHKTEGQSVILIAVVLTVLIGMAALAVDLGVTYAEQRNIVRGTNAASLAGMNRLISGGRDADIARAIFESLRSNGVQVTAPGEAPQPGDRTFEALYLGADGAPIAGACSRVGACGSQRPQGVKYIEIRLDGLVDTYFARLFGQDTLPVGSTAFSTVGACATGYYPIGVRTTVSNQPVFDENGFINYRGFYEDQTYAQLRFQRLYLRTETVPTGGFSLLRWNDSIAADSTGALATMLQGDGNYRNGYREAEWPDVSFGSDGPTEPASYPFEPDSISATDWILGNNFDGNPFAGDVANQLDVLQTNRTLMTLPMYRFDSGSTTNPTYYVERFGAFLLVDHGVDSDGVAPDGPWLELAYVREGGQCANLVTSAPPTTNRNLVGPVTYVPQFKTATDVDRPVQFLIVLDVSGSMAWNFAGQGRNSSGQTVTCTDPANACVSIDSAWPNAQERRIYIAKQVLRNFVAKIDEQKNNGTRPNDMVRIVTFSGRLGNYVNTNGQVGDNARAVNDLTEVLPAGWTNDRTTLEQAIDQAGMVNSDPYMTAGATPSAAGMARASQVFSSAPEFLGNQQYRRVVIFVTDGVANVLRNGMQNNYGENCAIGSENVGCQWGEIPGNPPILKPLTALAGEAETLKAAYTNPDGEPDGAVYVVALGGIDETGLDQVASQPDYVYSATQAGSLQAIFNNIQANAIYGSCTPGGGGNLLRDSMAASEVPTDLRPELSDVRVGKVTLTDSTGSTREAWIVADQQTRKLSYSFDDVPPGRYTMRAWVGYRAPEDNISRDKYELFQNGGTEMVVTISSGQGLGATISEPISLRLNESVCPVTP